MSQTKKYTYADILTLFTKADKRMAEAMRAF